MIDYKPAEQVGFVIGGYIMPEKLDLKGKRFGKLVVLEETDQRKDNKVVWKCQCDCGNIAYVVGTRLTQGKRKSCGCSHKPVDITGKRFGKLVAIKPTGEKTKTYSLWLCRCDCGNYVTYDVSTLTRGSATSCGCVKKDNENAMKRGKLSAKVQAEKAIDGVRPTDFNRKALSTNTSGYTGVYRKGNRWVAEIIVKGVKHRMFGFETPEQAYREGRLVLEEKYLPEGIKKRKG